MTKLPGLFICMCFRIYLFIYVFSNYLFIRMLFRFLSHERKQTRAVQSISGESSQTAAVVTAWDVRTDSELAAVAVVHNTFVYV